MNGMLKRSAWLACFLLSCGCAHKVDFLYNKVAALPPPSQAPTVSVHVAPRIGLFDELLYRRQSDFDKRIPAGALLREHRVLPNSDWVAIFPEAASEGGCDESINTLCGNLNHRAVTLRATQFEGKTSCEWTIQGVSSVPGSCQVIVRIDTNEQVSGQATVRDMRGEHIVPFLIPADRLFITLGDSYASGEGNPDVALNAPGMNPDKGDQPVWMSRRCHRSLWAGPVRAVLGMGPQPTRPEPNGDGVQVLLSGGVTIVSAACSGAEIAHVAQTRYKGRETVAQMMRAYKDNDAEYQKLPLSKTLQQFGNKAKLPSQIEQVSALLASGPHKPVEAVIVSIGGNDIEFGDIVTEFILNKKKDEPKGDFTTNISNLKSELAGLKSKISTSFNPVNVFLMAYPDPTRKTAEAAEEQRFCACTDGQFAGAGIFEEWKCMDRKENKFASNDILIPLNGMLEEFASANGWYFLRDRQSAAMDQSNLPPLRKFDTHAWCTPDSSRWIRTLSDSIYLQGKLPGEPVLSTGAMHPSADGLDYYGGIIREALKIRTADPVYSVRPPLATPRNGGPKIIGSKLALKWPESARFEATTDTAIDSLHQPKILLKRGDGSTAPLCKNQETNDNAIASCTFNASDRTITADLPASFALIPFTLEFEPRESITGRRLIVPDIGALQVDTRVPSIKCQLTGPDSSVDCSSLKRTTPLWIGDAMSLELTASDEKNIGLTWDCHALACPATSANGEKLRWQLPAPDAALAGLTVHVADAVGNKSEELSPFNLLPPLQSDTQAPAINKVRYSGAVWQSAKQAVVLSNERGVDVQLEANDANAGVRHSDGSGACTAAADIWIKQRVTIDSPVPGQRTTVKLSVSDCTWPKENIAELELPVGYIPLRPGQAPLSATYWKTRIKDKDEEILRYAALVKELTSGSIDLANIDDSSWPVAAAWLNLLDGRVAINAQLPAAPLPGCANLSYASSLAYLKSVTECPAAFAHSTRAKLERNLKTAKLLALPQNMQVASAGKQPVKGGAP
ncbi:MAG TPA: hypothetical protein VFX55_04545 [Duganella sp.]|nr:hypothetical protein [Duganella sp.]